MPCTGSSIAIPPGPWLTTNRSPRGSVCGVELQHAEGSRKLTEMYLHTV